MTNNMENRETRLLLRNYVIPPIYENAVGYEDGYRFTLQIKDDPRFIERFKTSDEVGRRIYDLEDEAYAKINRTKLEVVR